MGSFVYWSMLEQESRHMITDMIDQRTQPDFFYRRWQIFSENQFVCAYFWSDKK